MWRSSNYSFSEGTGAGKGIKTQNAQSGLIIYLNQKSNIAPIINFNASKNAADITVTLYTISNEDYNKFQEGTVNKTEVTFSKTEYTTKTIVIENVKGNYSETLEDIPAGYYFIVCTGTASNTYFNQIQFLASSTPAAKYSVTYKAGLGTGGDVVDDNATTVADCPAGFTAPNGMVFAGWKDEADTDVAVGATVSADMTLTAQWTAFDGCVMVCPATSGTAPAAVGDVIDTQAGSFGATITALDKVTNLTYNANGLQFGSTSGVKVKVVLNNEMEVGTTISLKLVAAGTGTRGLFLYDASGNKINDFTCWVDGTNPASNGAEGTFTYTVKAGDGLEGANEFQLGRNNTVILNTLKITDCGGKLVSINTAISPAEAVGKATITLSANTSVEGQTITATYSKIASGWDFDKWEVNGGATMDDAQANPVTITMGAENPTVTLVLKAGAIKHTVSFDAQGGSAVEPQLIEENGSPILPAEPTKEDYIFKGWAEAADGAAVDVTSFTITAPKKFYAIWESDGAIKLLDKTTGAINTTDFITGVTKGTVTISEVSHNCAIFGSTGSSIVGLTGLNKVVAYNATTTQTKVKFVLYNENNSPKEMYLQKVLEGATEAVTETIAVPSKTYHETQYYEYNSSDLRSFYITVNSTSIKILQVKVIETGTILKRAGQVGYSLNFNKGRVFGKGGSNISFEGLNATFSSDYKPIYSTEARINSTNISFNIASPVLLKVTTSNNKKYYVSQELNGTDNATEKTGTSEFELKTIGTWYVKADASEVKITKIEFLAPKCDAPVFNALSNSDICSGESYVALDGTATVSDGGTVTYKWYAEGADESDPAAVLSTDATYTPTADGSYYVVATNSLAGYTDNVVQSEVVTVTTHSSAAITTAPENVRMDAGETATLTVVAAGKNVTYQWYKCEADGNNATEIGGATADSYEVTVTTGVQYYKVVVSSDCGDPVEAVVKVEEWTELPLADVTGAITWDFSKAVTAETTLPSGDAEIVLANVQGVALNSDFESNKIKAVGNCVRKAYIQAKKLMFHATIPGKVTIEFSNTADDKEYDRILYVNGVATTAKSKNQDHVTYSIVVPAGYVVIQAWEKAAQPEEETWNVLNIYSLSFSIADYTRSGLTVGSLGTICLPSNVPAGHAFGATFYELKGKEPQYGKIVFDEILSGELEAGKPYLFQAQSDVLYCFYGTESVSDPDNSGAMKGTFVNLTLTNLTNIYYFAQKALWSCVDLTSLSVPANRAYVKMDEMPAITESNPAPGVRRITLGVNGQQVATGVDQVQGAEVPTKMIINGQLFILRGEKMYDAQGKLVK